MLQDAAQRQLEGQQEKQERAARRVQKLQRDLRSAGQQQQACHASANTFEPALKCQRLQQTGSLVVFSDQHQALQQYTSHAATVRVLSSPSSL